MMHKDGRGFAQNFKEAEKWLRLAAGQGVEKAQYELAVVLLRKAMIESSRVTNATPGNHSP
jgi:TPR repeat protein